VAGIPLFRRLASKSANAAETRFDGIRQAINNQEESFSGVPRNRSTEGGSRANSAYRGSDAQGQFRNLAGSFARQPVVALTWLAFLTLG
jgi:hypothetical protein